MARFPVCVIVAMCSAALTVWGGAGAGPVSRLSFSARGMSHAFGGAEAAASIAAYSCNFNGICYDYDANGNVVGHFRKGLKSPLGISTDAKGQLYVANSQKHSVVEYASNGSVLGVLRDPLVTPLDVAVSQSTKTIAVANAISLTGTATLSVYVNGATKPTRTLTDPAAAESLAVAFDRLGNCYMLFMTSGFGGLDEFTGCAGSPTRLQVAGYIDDIVFDGSGNLYYSEFAPGSSSGDLETCTGASGSCHVFVNIPGNPGAIRFNKSFTKMIIANLAGGTIYTLTLHGKQLSQFSSGGGTVAEGVSFATGPSY